MNEAPNAALVEGPYGSRWRCPCGWHSEYMSLWVLHGFYCGVVKP
jgi:hypothetical protein